MTMTTQKKNIIQSTKVTSLRGNLSTQECRIIARIVERCQSIINPNGDSLRTLVKQGTIQHPKTIELAFLHRDLTGTESHNYKPLKAAIQKLQQNVVQYYDYQNKAWYSAALISEAMIEEKTGRTVLKCPEWLLDYLCDLTQGANVYDVVRAFRLRRSSSIRLYMLLSHATTQLTYSLPQLRKWLGATDTYTQTRDFIKRCIEPARQEMEATGCNGFSYTLQRQGDGNRAKVTAITFIPIRREQDTDAEMMAKLSASNLLPQPFYNYLTTSLGLTAQEVGKNKAKLVAFVSLPQWERKLADIVDRARRKGKSKFYVLAAIKGETGGK